MKFHKDLKLSKPWELRILIPFCEKDISFYEAKFQRNLPTDSGIIKQNTNKDVIDRNIESKSFS